MADPLVIMRALHFLATLIVAGTVMFTQLVAEPALRMTAEPPSRAADPFRRHTTLLLWLGLDLAVLSGVAWLFLLAANIVDKPVADALAEGTAWTVLTQTRFGHVGIIRLVCAALLGAYALVPEMGAARWGGARSIWWRASAMAAAIVFLAALAWAGHGGSTPGFAGGIQAGGDVLHLIAAGAWLGGLVPLVVLLRQLRRCSEPRSSLIAWDAVRRFSTLGVVAVGLLFASGALNCWFLIGTIDNLIGTSYGRLVLLKIALFMAMLCVATVNRLDLLPRFARAAAATTGAADDRAVQMLARNTIAEILLGAAVIFVVGILGVMAPAIHAHEHLH